MLDNFSELIFMLANDLHMAVACLFISAINVYRSQTELLKIWPRRIKAFNWGILSLAFFLIYFVDASVAVERSWLRLSFALLIVGELSYHGDVIVNGAEKGIKRIRQLNKT